MINRIGCPARSLLAEWPTVWFHGLDFSLRGTATEADNFRAVGVEAGQESGGALEAGRLFNDRDWGRTLHRLYGDAGWVKKQEWIGPSVQHNREVKWRVQRRWRWLGFFWLKCLLQAASLIKLWILWSDQLNKLHLAGCLISPCAPHRCYVSCSVSPVLGSGSWHRQGLSSSVFLLIKTNPAPSVKKV